MQTLQGLAPAIDSRDPSTGLVAVAALRRLVDELEAVHVANARTLGWSWEAIATQLGITRQSVHKKYAARLTALAKDTRRSRKNHRGQ